MPRAIPGDDGGSPQEDPLGRYRSMRDFLVTREPAGAAPAQEEAAPRFVVQQHAARRMHWDLRLEAEGVLVSWAVPKGPSYDPSAKRLAVHVEDHPLEYRSFEGTIPKGEYGGGAVIVWDEGTYRHLGDRSVRDAVAAGHLSIWFEGRKLRGGWSLTRTGEAGDREPWILVKRRDDEADPGRDVTASSPESVRTGRTVAEVGTSEGEPTWTRGVATFQQPMLAHLGRPEGRAAGGPLADPPGTWLFEPKLDGLRCIAVRNGAEVALWSRNRLSFTARFPHVVAALRSLAPDNFVLDGEIVAMVGGRSSFSALQRGGDAPVSYAVFDLLHLLGEDVRHLPIEDRKELLARIAPEGAAVHVVRNLEGAARQLLETACEKGWEGLIAKRTGSPYSPGRSPAWAKLKCSASQELVVGGWTEPRGARVGFGALLVGYWEGEELHYAGKVGTCFTEATNRRLTALLGERAAERSPFAERVRERGAHWVTPDVVAEVHFGEWTPDGKLRHPRFAGLRPDKASREVVREDRGPTADP